MAPRDGDPPCGDPTDSCEHSAETDDGEATAADAAVVYLEAVVTAAFEARADEIDAELAGRCLLAEDVLYILTGSSDIDDVRAWLEARGLERLRAGQPDG